ncbi:MAG: lytic transglycosylase domain-containing protein [Spirochaetes bacterium]|jgi:soluble lytic murein transglycosylase-like protein|nr:lytic transglycosylase domain-containing protein [Spirochaetota bacterium]
MIEDMYAVMGRITEIRKRFGLMNRVQASVQRQDFQHQLEKLNGEGNAAVKAPEKTAASPARAMTVPELRDIAKAAALRNGIPPGLVDAVIQAESSYNPKAVSVKGARGLMQLMPETAGALGVADPFSPEENINAGVGLLKNLLEKYDGDYKKALAAYNAGEGAVDKNGGVPPYDETREYVNRVINLYLRNKE